MQVNQELLNRMLKGRTVQISASIEVADVCSTLNGAVWVKDKFGNVFKIQDGHINTKTTVFQYNIDVPSEWAANDGPVAGQVWRANGVDYAAMRNTEGDIVLRPMTGEDLYAAVYPHNYDRFLDMNPVLVKSA